MVVVTTPGIIDVDAAVAAGVVLAAVVGAVGSGVVLVAVVGITVGSGSGPANRDRLTTTLQH